MLAFGVARSEAHVYWTDDANDQISRADNDGGNIVSNFLWFTVGNPTAMVVDGTEIYWVNNSDNSVRRANIDGSGESSSAFIPGGFTSAWGVAIDSNYAYYTNVAGNSIGRKHRTTGELTQAHVVGTGTQPLSVAVDSAHIYWTSGENRIGRANLDGTGVDVDFIAGLDSPRTVAVNGSHIFWTNNGTGSIGRANLDGSNPNGSFVTGAHSPVGLAVGGGHIYWSNFNPNSIGRANVDGTGVNQNFMATSGFVSAVAVDNRVTPPSLTIDSGPDGWTNDSTPAFGFTAGAGSTVLCSIDTGTPSYGPCSAAAGHTPASALAQGAWTFRVKATNSLGGEATQARSFTVDTVLPQTTITGTDIRPKDGSTTFNFTSSESGSDFECQLGNDAWEDCASPWDYTLLDDDGYTFRVRAEDQAGNIDQTPAEHTFTIDQTPPTTTITSGPTGTITDDEVTFGFAANELAEFGCKLDDGPWEDCTSPRSYSGLEDGTHLFKVYAGDAFGNIEPIPATRSFVVDTAGPTGPTGPTDPTGPTGPTQPTGPTGPTGPTTPSSEFTFGKVKPNRKNGTATLQVKVPGAGMVQLLGSKTVKPATKQSKAASLVTLKVKAKGKAAKQLSKKGKAKVKARVRFTPTGGTAKTKSKAVKLMRKKAKR